MSVEPKVVAAIAGAINLYLQAEREALAAAAREEEVMPEAVTETAVLAKTHLPSLWALSGRQSAMEMRRMWQMRLVR